MTRQNSQKDASLRQQSPHLFDSLLDVSIQSIKRAKTLNPTSTISIPTRLQFYFYPIKRNSIEWAQKTFQMDPQPR